MAKGSKPAIPNEFYTASTFFTLSGIAGAVWLFCKVLANFERVDEYLDSDMYKLIALSLSLILAIMMMLRQKKKKKMEHWLFAFFNALLIFINASGLNAIENNVAFATEVTESQKIDSDQAERDSTQSASIFPLAGFPFLKNRVSWWPDKTLVMENKKLKVEYDILKKEITQIRNKIDSTESVSGIISEDNEQLAESLNKQFATIEEIKIAYSNLNNRFITVSEALTACETEREILTDRINDLTTRYEAEKEKNAELNERYSIQTEELAATQQELARCQSRIEELSKEAERNLALYNSEKGKNKELTKTIEDLEKKLEKKTSDYNRLKRSSTNLEREINELKGKLKECESKLPKPRQID